MAPRSRPRRWLCRREWQRANRRRASASFRRNMFNEPNQRRSQCPSKSKPLARAEACVFESIEERRMMSVALQTGVLTIQGTDGNDKVVVELLSNGRIRVTDNGKVSSFKVNNVKQVSASLGAGNDSY